MARYEITGPDGKKYEVTAPEGTSEQEILAYVQKSMMPQMQSAPDLADVARMGIGQGALFGFGDELEAGARAIPSLWNKPGEPSFVDNYIQKRNAIRSDMDQFRKNHPMTALGLEVGGSMLTGLAGAARMGALNTAGKVGLVEGGIAGAGHSESSPIEDPVGLGIDVVRDGAIGYGAGKVIDGVADYVNPRAVARNKAHEQILSGQTQDQAIQKVQDLGDGATLADTGINARSVAGAAYRRAPDKEQFGDFILGRQMESPNRIEEAISNVTGINMSRVDAEDAIRAAQRQIGDQLYSPLNGAPVQPQGPLMEAYMTPHGQQAAEKALQALRLKTRNPQLDIEEAAGTFDFWHFFQQGLGEVSESLRSPMNPGMNRMAGGELGKVRGEVMGELFDQVPGYQDATNAYRQTFESLDAIKDSTKFAKTHPDKLKKDVAKMTDQQKAAYAIGIVDDMVQKVLNAPETANSAWNSVKSANMKRRLEIILGPEKATRLVDAMDKEIQKTLTYNEVMRGSQTAERQAAEAIFAGGTDGLVDTISRAGGAIPGLVQWGRNQVGNIPRITSGRDKAAQEVLSLMQQTDPQEITNGLARQSAVSIPLAGGVLGGLLNPEWSAYY